MSKILSPWCVCRFCSSWQMVEDAVPLRPHASLTLSLASQLEADHAHHGVGPVQDLRSCVVDVQCSIKLQQLQELRACASAGVLCGPYTVLAPSHGAPPHSLLGPAWSYPLWACISLKWRGGQICPQRSPRKVLDQGHMVALLGRGGVSYERGTSVLGRAPRITGSWGDTHASCCPQPHGGIRPFHQKSTLTPLTLRPYVVQIWARNTPASGVNKPLVLHRVGVPRLIRRRTPPPYSMRCLQGYLAHKKHPPP